MASSAAAFQQLAGDSKAMAALNADPKVFSALASNAASFKALSGQPQALQAAVSSAASAAHQLQSAGISSSAMAALAANPQAFAMLAGQPQAMAAIAGHSNAFAALASQPQALAAVLANASAFSSFANNAEFVPERGIEGFSGRANGKECSAAFQALAANNKAMSRDLGRSAGIFGDRSECAGLRQPLAATRARCNPQLLAAMGSNASAFSQLASQCEPAERRIEGAPGARCALDGRIRGGV